MSDYTIKELMEAIYEVRDRATRIEEKLNHTEKLAGKVDGIEKVSNLALVKSEQNAKDIDSMKKNNMWAWGFVITALLAVVAQYFGIGK
ncbi:hemolysin XhlA family protein [Paenibacillus alvei]|uniref:hemolysin XhlA family protein n=1 Tax=Paenibacillus alvei TaxID=44250 RepID=UPI00227EC211|nr:hemolysin XhlA family protein [Paenibacillus alvei]MCY9737463.1 hemolysin XhlA family protein [Paenibacillus alvei]